MRKPNAAMQYPSEYVTLHLDRYTAQRLLLALTQALEPSMDYKDKKGKKGKGPYRKSGMKLTKGYKGGLSFGVNLTKS